MNYFTLFEIPVSLQVDSAALLKKYYSLSRQFHPDNYSNSGTAEQEIAELQSANLNEAKKILDNPYKRLEYILREKGMIHDDEKYTLPPLFLGEMMDINEQLMELEFDKNESDLLRIKQEIADMESNLFQSVAHLFEQAELQMNEVESSQLKEYYYKKKYLQRIKERLV